MDDASFQELFASLATTDTAEWLQERYGISAEAAEGVAMLARLGAAPARLRASESDTPHLGIDRSARVLPY